MQQRQMKIIDGAPTAAIYARKSKATDKGESVENQILDTKQLADYLGLSETTIYRKRKEGLPHYKDNKKCYHLISEVSK